MAPSINHLGKGRIAQLLAAVGSRHDQDQVSPPATPYDWRDPHYFNADQQNRLTQVLGQVAARATEIFTRIRGGACEVSLKSCTQHFASDWYRHIELDQSYCLAFASEKGQPCGFASVSFQTTATWVKWLLGDSDSTQDQHRTLSALEESLLCDLVTAVLEALLTPLRAHHNLRPVSPLCKGQPNLQFELTEELARITFQVKSADPGEPTEITFILPCDRLAALAGKATSAAAKVTPQELSRALMEHVQALRVTIRATLASTTLTFQEILELSPGDILLLDKPVSGPAELILDGRTVFRGRPARSQGRYAVAITESETGTARPAPAAPTPKQAPERK
jgi:flagellar motor switch protein FliM